MAPGSDLPPKAKEMQARLREEKAAMLRQKPGIVQQEQQEQNSTILDAVRKQEEADQRPFLQRIWMGSEGADWKQKRDEREKKALEEGKGYGDLIMDQIWEVWNWGKTDGDEEKKDESLKK